jgi:hypothetical protein
MNAEKQIETPQVNTKDHTVDWNIWDAILLAFIVVYVIFVPIGGFFYLIARFNPYLILFPFMLIYLPLSVLLLIFTVIWTLRFFIKWTKYTQRKKIIRFLQVCIPAVFIASFFVSVLTPIETSLWQPGYKPFTYGFGAGIRSKADIEAIRNWLETLKNEDCTGETIDLFRNSDSLKS